LIKSLGSITQINDLVIKIHSFIACNVLESQSALLQLFLAKVSRDIQGQLLHLAGSLFGKLNAIGRPADLLKRVGGGVQDFFYEPYQGLMKSPKDFAKGLEKGTSSLIKGLVQGTVTSAMTIVETASLGVSSTGSFISGDDAQKREETRRKNEASSKGILGGLLTGATSVVTGVGSGITGIVTKPMEGAKKDGALGFMKGVGKGVIGVALSPIVGITDGIAAVAHGLSSQVVPGTTQEQLRGARLFLHVREENEDEEGLRLVPIDRQLISAETTVKRHGLSVVSNPALTLIDVGSGGTVLISALHVSIRHGSDEVVVDYNVLSHFAVSASSTRNLDLFLIATSGPGVYAAVHVKCADEIKAQQLYDAMLRVVDKMQNPSKMKTYS
jgi:hypothetical protein